MRQQPGVRHSAPNESAMGVRPSGVQDLAAASAAGVRQHGLGNGNGTGQQTDEIRGSGAGQRLETPPTQLLCRIGTMART